MSKFSLASSPHNHLQRDTGAVMRMVVYAALPGIAVQVFMFGYGLLIQLALAITTAVISEIVVLELRNKNSERAVKDYSAVLTAVLLAISIPPLAPWWVIVIGTFFSIVIVKQLYGGLGYNMFNPAMAGYIMLLISFPVQMTSWLPATSLTAQSVSLWDAVYTVFSGYTASGYSIEQLKVTIDGTSMATPLDHVKTALAEGYVISEALNDTSFSGAVGKGWGPVALAYLAGGLFLLKAKIINWHIPISMIVGAALMSTILYMSDPSTHASPWFHIINGSLLFGAFFIATDPVSASTTNRGRLIFGMAIGVWVIIIRTWGAYPDAIAFAVVIMNMAVPLIDYYTRPRTYGHREKAKNMQQKEPK
ncbi:MAG: electron transport complex subunit RsxD [Glaciecola sp.]